MKLFIMVILSTLISTVNAGELYLNTYIASKHLNADRFVDSNGNIQRYNERNYGTGLTYIFTPNISGSVSSYKNSIFKTSKYIAFTLHTDRRQIVGVGVNIGIVTGYVIDYLPIIEPVVRINITKTTAVVFTYSATKQLNINNSDVIGLYFTSKVF